MRRAENTVDKKCSRCLKIKSCSEFYRNTYGYLKLRSECKVCCRLKTRLYIKSNRIKRNIYERTSPRARFNSYRRSAKQRGFVFSLTFIEFMQFWKADCFYCYAVIEFIGIDRIDNSRGYSKDNSVPCCSVCNKMKLTLTQEEFFNQCNQIITKRMARIND